MCLGPADPQVEPRWVEPAESPGGTNEVQQPVQEHDSRDGPGDG